MEKLSLDKFWAMTQDDLFEQIQIWTGIAVGWVSGNREAAQTSAAYVFDRQMKLREALNELLARGFTEMARADFLRWLQEEGFVEV